MPLAMEKVSGIMIAVMTTGRRLSSDPSQFYLDQPPVISTADKHQCWCGGRRRAQLPASGEKNSAKRNASCATTRRAVRRCGPRLRWPAGRLQISLVVVEVPSAAPAMVAVLSKPIRARNPGGGIFWPFSSNQVWPFAATSDQRA